MYAIGYLQTHTSNTYANNASLIMMLIKRIITGIYMFIEGSILPSKRVYLSPILGPTSLGERRNPLYPAPLLAYSGATIYGHMVAICL